MIKGKIKFFSLIFLLAMTLISCSYQNSKEDANSNSIVVSPSVVDETKLHSSINEELPDIPTISFGPGDVWFQPTDPDEIQLASGMVQVFKFSASW